MAGDFEGDIERELVALEIHLNAAAERTSLTLRQYIQSLQAQGIPDDQIEALLLDDLLNEGRIFSEFRNAVKSKISDTYGALQNRAALARFEDDFESPDFTWIAALVNTCKDCLPRHGSVNTYAEWERLGLPKSGWSVCRGHCQCQLIPTEATANRRELMAPIIRERRDARSRGAIPRPGRALAAV